MSRNELESYESEPNIIISKPSTQKNAKTQSDDEKYLDKSKKISLNTVEIKKNGRDLSSDSDSSSSSDEDEPPASNLMKSLGDPLDSYSETGNITSKMLPSASSSSPSLSASNLAPNSSIPTRNSSWNETRLKSEDGRERSASLGPLGSLSPKLKSGRKNIRDVTGSPVSPDASKGNSNRIEIPINELTIKDKLGEGAFGAVYRAELWGSEVAVKQFINISSSCMSEFYHEVSVLKSLRHVNIVTLMGYSRQPFSIICEILNQGSLFSVLHDDTIRISHSQIMKAILGSAQGINYLHSKGIFHKDIKSQNVLIGDNFEKVKVCDFGLSLVRNDESGTASKYVGSAQWRAPEATSSFYNNKCDVYSFGILLWECLTRKRPFDGIPVPDTLAQIRSGNRPVIPFYCPPAFRSLIERCWHSDPEKRPEFEEIIKELSSDLFIGGGGKNEEEESVSSQVSAVREAQSLHFILPEPENKVQSTPRYARVYSSMFRPLGTEEGVNYINDFMFDRDSNTWDGEKTWDGGMLFTGNYGNYTAVLVFDTMQSLKEGDNQMIKNVKHFERMAELSCKSYMSELLELVALDVKPGANSVLVFRFQVSKGLGQDILEEMKTKVIPIMKEVEGWRGNLVFMNHETRRTMVMNLFESESAMKEFQKMTPKTMTPLRDFLEGVPTIEKLKLEHGYLNNLIIKSLK